MKTIQLLILLFLSHSLFSQTTGKVRLIVSPPNSMVKLNGQISDSKNKIFELEEGIHTFEVWAPYMEMEKHEIKVIPDSTHYLKVVLKKEQDFLQYKTDVKKYYRDKSLSWGLISGSVILAGGSSYYLFNPKIKNDFEEAELQLEQKKLKYESSFGESELNIARNDYIESKKETEKAQRRNITQKAVGIPLTLLSVGAVYWSIKRLKKKNKSNKKPTYEIKNPFSEVDIRPEMETIGMNIYSGFSLKISF